MRNNGSVPEARNNSQLSAPAAGKHFCSRGILEIKLQAVEGFPAQNPHTGKLPNPGRCATDDRMLHLFRDVQVEPPIVMLAIFFLQLAHQRTQGRPSSAMTLASSSAFSKSVALRQMLGHTDAARLFAADEDVLVQHQFAYILEADAML